MYFGLVFRTIFGELLKIFSIALFALTGLILMAGVVAEASRNGLGPAQILAIIPLLIPSTLPYTLPATTLFATCVVYGRLASDNEILAIKAAGIHISQVVWPAVWLGILTSGLTLGLYINTIPFTHFVLKSQIVADVEELLYGMLKKDGCIRHPRIDYTIYVRRIEGRKLIDAQFLRRDPKGQRFDVVARAREAELIVDMNHKQILINMKHCHIANDNGDIAFVDSRVWPVDLPDGFGVFAKDRPTDMTWSELFERRDQLAKERDGFESQIALEEAALQSASRNAETAKRLAGLQGERKHRQSQIYAIDNEVHMRPALALGCLCFVLVGCPVGIWFSKSDYLSAFITCFLPIVTIYYPLLLCTINISRGGRFGGGVAIWLADTLMLLTAAYLFRWLSRN